MGSQRCGSRDFKQQEGRAQVRIVLHVNKTTLRRVLPRFLSLVSAWGLAAGGCVFGMRKGWPGPHVLHL